MPRAVRYTVCTVFYTGTFFALVTVPQLLSHALGAPVTL